MPTPFTLAASVVFLALMVAAIHRWTPAPTKPAPFDPRKVAIRHERVTAGVRETELWPSVVADVEAVLTKEGW